MFFIIKNLAQKIFASILEINNASFFLYLIIISNLIGLDFFNDGLLVSLGLKLKSLIIFLFCSAGLKTYYYRKEIWDYLAYLKLSELNKEYLKGRIKTILNPHNFRLKQYQQHFFFLIGPIAIYWSVFWYVPTLSIRNILSNDGFSSTETTIIVLLLFFLILLNINLDDPTRETNLLTSSNQLQSLSSQEIKSIYKVKKEEVKSNRLSHHHPLRRYAHETEFCSIVKFIKEMDRVLDNGCGDGYLAIKMAKNGALVTACDISEPNIVQAKIYAQKDGLADKINFLVADAENLPFANDSFDWVVSSHVLEHLPDFQKGLNEVKRVTRKKAVIALPTCLNPCAAIVLGGDKFWCFSRWTPTAWLVGLIRIILGIGGEGVDEGYSGNLELPHIWRYPWVMRKRLKQGGFKIIHFEASSLVLPYFNFLLPFIKYLEKFKAKPIIRNFGYGSIAVVEKINPKPYEQSQTNDLPG